MSASAEERPNGLLVHLYFADDSGKTWRTSGYLWEAKTPYGPGEECIPAEEIRKRGMRFLHASVTV